MIQCTVKEGIDMAGALKKHPVHKSFQDVRRTRDRLNVYRANHVTPDTDRHKKVSYVIQQLNDVVLVLEKLDEGNN